MLLAALQATSPSTSAEMLFYLAVLSILTVPVSNYSLRNNCDMIFWHESRMDSIVVFKTSPGGCLNLNLRFWTTWNKAQVSRSFGAKPPCQDLMKSTKVWDQTEKKTSQEMRMLSRSLSDCKSLLLNLNLNLNRCLCLCSDCSDCSVTVVSL